MSKNLYQEYLTSRMGYQIKRASSFLMADLRARLEQENLNPTQASILLILMENDTPIQSAIGNMLGIKRANMVPLINKLEDDGLIRRRRLDGRSYALDITDAGKKAVARVKQHIDEHDAHYRSKLSDEFVEMAMTELPKLWS